MLSCLTAAFCVLIVVYNFASMPPYGVQAASAVPLYNSSQQSEDIHESSETDKQTSETDNTEISSISASASTTSKSNSTIINTGSTTATVQSKTTSVKAAPQGPVNINTASLEQLESIPYIGPTKAQAILDYRNQNGSFTSVDALDSVKGIGAKTIDKIRQYITVG